MALVLAGRRRAAERAFEWLAVSSAAATAPGAGTTWPKASRTPAGTPTSGAYVATGAWWHYLLHRRPRPARGHVAGRRGGRRRSCCACSSPAVRCCGPWIPTVTSAATPCSPAPPPSTTACAAPWPSPSASGSSGRSGSWPPTGSWRPSSTGRGPSRPRTAGPWTGTTRSCPAPCPVSRPGERIDGRWSEFVLDGVGVRCVSDHPWVTAAETAECVMALDAIGLRDQAGPPARLDPAPARRRRRLLDRMRAPRVRPVSRGASAAPTPPRPSCWPTTPSTGSAPAPACSGARPCPASSTWPGLARTPRRGLRPTAVLLPGQRGALYSRRQAAPSACTG